MKMKMKFEVLAGDSIESKSNTYRPPVYASLITACLSFILSAISDFFCFVQLLSTNNTNSLFWERGFWKDSINNLPVLVGLMLAFDAAPLYIGYMLCIKSIRQDCKDYHKNDVLDKAFVFSIIAFVLGIITNFILRLREWDGIEFWCWIRGMHAIKACNLKLIAMCFIPLITSLMSLTVGCLTFDPLQFDLNRISKKLAELRVQRVRLKEYIKKYETSDGKYEETPDLALASKDDDNPDIAKINKWGEMMKHELDLYIAEEKNRK